MKAQKIIVTFAEKPKRFRDNKETKTEKSKVLPAHKGKVLCLVAIAVSMNACSGLYGGNYDMVMMGSESGFRSLSDWQVGTINEVRTPEGTKGSHYQLREQQTGMEALKAKLQEMKNGRK